MSILQEPLGKSLEADVAIIGGGIVGACIARELSQYKVETVLIEKHELNAGQSRGTLGLTYWGGLGEVGSAILKSVIAPGSPLYDPESVRLRLQEKGYYMWFQRLLELDIDYKFVKNLIIATNEEELKLLDNMHKLSFEIGPFYMDHRYIERDEILEMEPAITQDVIRGLVDSGRLTFRAFPPEMTYALVENAQQNGAKIIEDAEVTGITHNGGAQIIHTRRGDIKANFVVNAAGRFADEIARMGGYCDWKIELFKCPLIIMDKSLPRINNFTMLPPIPGRPLVISPTNEGNTFVVAGLYTKVYDRRDLSTDRESINYAINEAHRISPSITLQGIIRSFGGLRAVNNRNPEENIIEFASDNPRFLNCAIRLPGMAQAPGVADYVLDMLGNHGLELVKKSDFNPYRNKIPRFRELSDFYRRQLIEKDPRYGHVVCRCETITEGEICEAIKRGARSVDSVKLRCRAGMGRCQGGFCGPRVVAILARELGVPEERIRQKEEGTFVVPYRSKELSLRSQERGVLQ
jgi:glycerol-3-phosphate dehydrogenase